MSKLLTLFALVVLANYRGKEVWLWILLLNLCCVQLRIVQRDVVLGPGQDIKLPALDNFE